MQATEYAFDLRTLSPSSTTYFGVYGEDFLTYAEFAKDQNPDDDTWFHSEDGSVKGVKLLEDEQGEVKEKDCRNDVSSLWAAGRK